MKTYTAPKNRFYVLLTSMLALTMLLGTTIPENTAFAKKPTFKGISNIEATGSSQTGKRSTSKKQVLTPPGPDDKYDRGVPRTSVQGFYRVTSEGDYKQASQYLDLRNLPQSLKPGDGPSLARKLKIVLNRTLSVDPELLSMHPKGHLDDGLPRTRDRIGLIKIGKRRIEISLQRVPRGDGVYIWKFSSSTVANIPKLYDAHGFGRLGEYLSSFLPNIEFFGLQLWQWVLTIILIIITFIAAHIPMWYLARFLRKRDTDMSRQLSRFAIGPGKFLLFMLLLFQFSSLIDPSIALQSIMEAATVLTVAFTWAVLRSLDILRDYYSILLVRRNRNAATVLLRPAANILKAFVIIIAVLVWLDNLGFKITTLLAGLGIGGLAVALAAQKTLENLIGAITLYSSAPVRVGEYCRFGEKAGVIEEIGLRSTRIRTNEGSLINIPNGAFADMHLENFANRDKIRFHPIVSVRMDTSPDQIRYILVEVQKMLYSHPKLEPKSARIRFVGYGEYSLDLKVVAYVQEAEHRKYLGVAEDLYLRILDIITKAGTTLAIPAQINFQEESMQTNRDIAHAAEIQVETWRNANELYLPKFPPEMIDELRGTVEYPPKGSPVKD